MEIPGYKILDTLGQGGMATVYLAIQESFQRKVAIKVMSAQLAQDPAFGDRFQREARIVSQMNHPNIVTVYDVGVFDDHHYLAMEYVEGKELRSLMSKISLMDKIRIVKDVAMALNYAGNKGYVHRDVKPDNVMVGEEDGRAVLMDFGIAKASDANHSMTKTGMAIGTPYYMSPEQAQGQAVDKRSDIYSLGVMFFQLLTGYVPYDAESGVAIGIKHVTEPVPLLPKHLRIFQPILEKVMAKDPDRRYQKGSELAADLDKINLEDMDQVDEIIRDEEHKASNTDTSAQTVLTDVPPIISTGNVTTADAARVARNLNAGNAMPPPQKKKKQSPVIGLLVIMVTLAAVAYWLQLDKQQNITSVISALQTEDKTVQDAELKKQAAEKAQQEQQQALVEAKARAEAEAKAAQAEAQAREKAKRDRSKAEEKARLEAEAQVRAEAEARAAAEQKRQEEAAAIKAAAAKAARAKAEQEKQEQIARLLNRAQALHESGALVMPENDNAVLAYRAVLAVDSKNSTATSALNKIESNYLLGIRTLIEHDDLDGAASQLRSASKLYPNSIAINELLAKHQQKVADQEAAKFAATQPGIQKIIVSESAFQDVAQRSQNQTVALGRNAYVGFSYKNFQGATTLLQAILYDSSRTVKIMQKPVVVTGQSGQVFFTLSRPVEGFSDGGYTIDLMVGAQRLGSVSFAVAR